MAHDIDGARAIFSGTPAWHKIGTIVPAEESISVERAVSTIHPEKLFKLDLSTDDGAGNYRAVESHKAIVRSGDGRCVGVVGKDYELMQPHETAEFFQPFLDQGLAKIESGGILAGGSRMWMLAKLTGATAEIVKGDPINGYFLVHTSFDGSLSHGFKFTGTRVVCANTLAMALSGGGESYTTRHTKNMRDRIADVQAQVDVSQRTFAKACEVFRALAAKKVSEQTMKAYVRRVFVTAEQDAEALKKGGKQVSAQTETKVARVIDLLELQRGLELVPAARGTMWQAYNAVSEYITHEAGRSDDTRLNSQWFGQGATLNRQALTQAMAVQ